MCLIVRALFQSFEAQSYDRKTWLRYKNAIVPRVTAVPERFPAALPFVFVQRSEI